MKKLFGTDGIRGIVNQDLSVDLALIIGKILKIFNKNTLIIGHDTRISSPFLSYAITSGASSMGINVYDEGICSTPSIAFLSNKFSCLGVMITASHNPFFYNGIKIFIDGNKLNKEQEEKIENLVNNSNLQFTNEIGLYKKSNLKEHYLQYIDKFFDENDNLRIGIDAANGALSNFAYKIYNKLTSSLYLYNCLPNGYNINDNVGSTYIETIQKYVLDKSLNFGISFDGDGDRCLIVNKDGVVLNGNIIIYILAIYFFDILNYENRSVVLTKDTNPGVIEAFRKAKINVILSDIGDNNVRQKMDENNVILGGEDSGHIISPYSRYGDGVLTSLIFLKAIKNINIPVEKLIKDINLYPFIKLNISKYKKEILDDSKIKTFIEELAKSINKDGMLLIRKSGTENLIRIYLCHKSKYELEKYHKSLINMFEQMGEQYER